MARPTTIRATVRRIGPLWYGGFVVDHEWRAQLGPEYGGLTTFHDTWREAYDWAYDYTHKHSRRARLRMRRRYGG